jgi:hypothetical protein
MWRGASVALRHAGASFSGDRYLSETIKRFASVLAFVVAGCAAARTPPVTAAAAARPGATLSASQTAFLDTLEQRTFAYFWETTNPRNGLVPDRWPTPSFSSVAAVGFALTAYPVGVEHGWITRAQAQERVLTTLRFFWGAREGTEHSRVTGYHGFFYHFLDMQRGERFEHVEISTIDTGLLLAGALVCRQYFDGASAGDSTIRALADSLYLRADWNWARDGETTLSMGWRPDSAPYQNERGFITTHWKGYDEGMILYVLALGSPTHAIDPVAWQGWTSTYQWGDFEGQKFVQFAPMFGHQYSHVWIDFRGIADDYMRNRGIDYFENSRRAVLSQQRYAIDNPDGWRGYGASTWGLSASDGPLDSTFTLDGKQRTFHTYWARGASSYAVRDDGTITPSAVGGSFAFAPELAISSLSEMRQQYGDSLFSRYGFVDAFNPTLREPVTPLHHGYIVPGVGWFDRDYLGIDQGPIVAMIENERTGLVWRLMRENPYVVRGLCRAGFTGGWLTGRCVQHGRGG